MVKGDQRGYLIYQGYVSLKMKVAANRDRGQFTNQRRQVQVCGKQAFGAEVYCHAICMKEDSLMLDHSFPQIVATKQRGIISRMAMLDGEPLGHLPETHSLPWTIP